MASSASGAAPASGGGAAGPALAAALSALPPGIKTMYEEKKGYTNGIRFAGGDSTDGWTMSDANELMAKFRHGGTGKEFYVPATARTKDELNNLCAKRSQTAHKSDRERELAEGSLQDTADLEALWVKMGETLHGQRGKLATLAYNLGGSGKRPEQRVFPTGESAVCAVCLDTVTPGVKGSLRTSCCGNAYHEACFSPWMLQAGSCPSCRDEREVPAAAAADAAAGDAGDAGFRCMRCGRGQDEEEGLLAICDWPGCDKAICKVECNRTEIFDWQCVPGGPWQQALSCPDHASQFTKPLVFDPEAQLRSDPAGREARSMQRRERQRAAEQPSPSASAVFSSAASGAGATQPPAVQPSRTASGGVLSAASGADATQMSSGKWIPFPQPPAAERLMDMLERWLSQVDWEKEKKGDDNCPSTLFGWSVQRHNQEVLLRSRSNGPHPEIWVLLQMLARLVGIEYTNCMIKRLKAGPPPAPHRHSGNCGPSYGLALGTFQGGGLLVGGEPVQNHRQIFEFDGTKEHGSAEVTDGTRFAVVWYRNASVDRALSLPQSQPPTPSASAVFSSAASGAGATQRSGFTGCGLTKKQKKFFKFILDRIESKSWTRKFVDQLLKRDLKIKPLRARGDRQKRCTFIFSQLAKNLVAA